MISENIKELRKQKGLTQKELAEKLIVTSQAVSRWETGDVEPSIDTISNMAKIFGVTTDELIGGSENKPQSQVVYEEKEKSIVQQAKPMLALCSQCKKPIYESKDVVTKRIGRGGQTYICRSCDEKNKERARVQAIEHSASQRRKSYVWGGILGAVVLAVLLVVMFSQKLGSAFIAAVVVGPILTYTFVSCLFLKNNFIGDMFLSISSWGFVKFPGLIFSLDLDGIIWLLTVKLALWILGLVLGVLAIMLALTMCMPISLFVYPFALKKSIRSPEKTD